MIAETRVCSTANVIQFKPGAGRIVLGPPSTGLDGLRSLVYHPPIGSHPLRGTHYIGSYLSREEAFAVGRVFAPMMGRILGEEVIVIESACRDRGRRPAR